MRWGFKFNSVDERILFYTFIIDAYFIKFSWGWSQNMLIDARWRHDVTSRLSCSFAETKTVSHSNSDIYMSRHQHHHVHFGSQAYEKQTQSLNEIKALERVQRHATKFILKCDLTYPERLAKLGLLPLEFRREVLDFCFFFNCLDWGAH